MYKLDLEKAEEPEIKLPTSIGSEKKQDKSTTSSLTKAFDYVSQQTGKFLEMRIPDHLT